MGGCVSCPQEGVFGGDENPGRGGRSVRHLVFPFTFAQTVLDMLRGSRRKFAKLIEQFTKPKFVGELLKTMIYIMFLPLADRGALGAPPRPSLHEQHARREASAHLGTPHRGDAFQRFVLKGALAFHPQAIS